MGGRRMPEQTTLGLHSMMWWHNSGIAYRAQRTLTLAHLAPEDPDSYIAIHSNCSLMSSSDLIGHELGLNDHTCSQRVPQFSHSAVIFHSVITHFILVHMLGNDWCLRDITTMP